MAVGIRIDVEKIRRRDELPVNEGVFVRSVVIWRMSMEDVGENQCARSVACVVLERTNGE